eukprot:2812389-Heterocapsa_arctica.AAC.1
MRARAMRLNRSELHKSIFFSVVQCEAVRFLFGYCRVQRELLALSALAKRRKFYPQQPSAREADGL